MACREARTARPTRWGASDPTEGPGYPSPPCPAPPALLRGIRRRRTPAALGRGSCSHCSERLGPTRALALVPRAVRSPRAQRGDEESPTADPVMPSPEPHARCSLLAMIVGPRIDREGRRSVLPAG